MENKINQRVICRKKLEQVKIIESLDILSKITYLFRIISKLLWNSQGIDTNIIN